MSVSSVVVNSPPASNTGVNMTNSCDRYFRFNPEPRFVACIDWLQGTFPHEFVSEVELLIQKIFNDGEFQLQSHGIKNYEIHKRSPLGVIIGVTESKKFSPYANRAFLELTGSVLNRISVKSLRLLFIGLQELAFKPTRCDLTLDDLNKSFRPIQLKEAYDKRWVTGFKKTGVWREKGIGKEVESSMSFGRRGKKGSGKYLICYDKFLESKGEIDSVRLELSCYRKYAVEAFQALCLIEDVYWTEIILGYINGSIDFVNRGEDINNLTRADRCKRLSWWAKLVDDSQKLKFSSPRSSNKQIEAIEWWLKRQVAPSLATVFNAKSKSDESFGWLLDLVEEGTKRMNDKQKLLVEGYAR